MPGHQPAATVADRQFVAGNPLPDGYALHEGTSLDHAADALVSRAEWIGMEFAEAARIGEEVPATDAADLHLNEKLVSRRFRKFDFAELDLPLAQIEERFGFHECSPGDYAQSF